MCPRKLNQLTNKWHKNDNDKNPKIFPEKTTKSMESSLYYSKTPLNQTAITNQSCSSMIPHVNEIFN